MDEMGHQKLSLHFISLPSTTPILSRMMKGLLLPRADLHLSDKLPRIGVRKKPTRGDRHQIRVMCVCDTPSIEIYRFLMKPSIDLDLFCLFFIWPRSISSRWSLLLYPNQAKAKDICLIAA